MGRRIQSRAAVLSALAAGAALAFSATTAVAQTVPDAIDCLGPAPKADYPSDAWTERERNNALCALQGGHEEDANPASRFAWALGTSDPMWTLMRDRTVMESDPLRYPPLFWDGKRGNWQYLKINAPYGKINGAGAGAGSWPEGDETLMMGTQLFWPLRECIERRARSCPKGVPTHPAPPYPAIAINGGSANGSNELLRMAQVLAEHGYVVMTSNYFQSGTNHDGAMMAMVDYLSTTQDNPNRAGQVNVIEHLTDREHIGIVGYSNADTLTAGIRKLLMNDPRIDAMVYGIWNGDRPDAPGNRQVTDGKPQLYFSHEYNVPVADQPMQAPPDPELGGIKTVTGNEGADVVVITPRASMHYDMIDPRAGGKNLFWHSRLGPEVHDYYTLAFFDKQLWGPRSKAIEEDATERLVADRFDDSIDESNIGTGRYSVARAAAAGNVLAGNIPDRIDGLPVPDRMSFYIKSGYSLNGGKLECFDMQKGCTHVRPAKRARKPSKRNRRASAGSARSERPSVKRPGTSAFL